MHTFLTFIKEFKFPKKGELENALLSLESKKFYLFIALLLVAGISVIVLLNAINQSFMVTVPQNGGSITEGIIGMPTLVNPVLALSDTDKDLTTLVYSGLMRKMPDGTFVPDIAESYTTTNNGMTYTFTLKKGLTFHDGSPITSDDVLFTIGKIKDPLVKSPRKIGWDGVTVEKASDMVIVFTLKQPYISFLDNTTLGILPMHVWKNVNSNEFSLSPFNIKAIGSGPYQINTVQKNADGVPIEYSLRRFKSFALGAPHIEYITLISFSNEKELIKNLLNKTIDQAGGLSSENTESLTEAGYVVHTSTLPRLFGIFFNSTNNKIFANTNILKAFDKALDRKVIIDTVLHGYGTAIYHPIPETIITKTDSTTPSLSLDEAQDILEKEGWVMGEDGIRSRGGTKVSSITKKIGKKTILQRSVTTTPITRLGFTLTTGNSPELIKASELVKEQLKKIGVEVDVRKYEPGPLNQIIRARSYEGLFFGQFINHESDLYSFWHSSQKNDPGLNIGLYSSKNADSILESIQKNPDFQSRVESYKNLLKEFNTTVPALMIYSPKYIYVTSSKIHNITFDSITTSSDRLGSVYTWYANEDQVWKIFNNK